MWQVLILRRSVRLANFDYIIRNLKHFVLLNISSRREVIIENMSEDYEQFTLVLLVTGNFIWQVKLIAVAYSLRIY